jgi:hypothetical protein
MTAVETAVLVLLPLASCAPDGERGVGSAGDDAAGALAEDIGASITVEGLERHARAIVQYERPSGGPGENAAIDSIVASLRADGVPVEVHAFDTYASDPVSAEVRVPAAGLSLAAITMAYSGSTSGLSGPLVDVGGSPTYPTSRSARASFSRSRARRRWMAEVPASPTSAAPSPWSRGNRATCRPRCSRCSAPKGSSSPTPKSG